VAKVEVIETGHAAGTMAVRAAWEAVRAGAEFALAGGVDSYLDPDTLEWLEANEQVHGAAPANNAWGFTPGEAAGFVLLASAAAAGQYRLPQSFQLLSTATARETKLIKTDAVCVGEGLTDLFRALAASLVPGTQADQLYCDMNGEAYRADEFGFAVLRVGGLFRDPGGFIAPADCWGDVGAASGPLLLLLAEAAARKGYAPGPVAGAFTSAESGERCGWMAGLSAQPEGRSWG
jgi:3-oxoacyl-[acyl-carrier-protein] synthase-1